MGERQRCGQEGTGGYIHSDGPNRHIDGSTDSSDQVGCADIRHLGGTFTRTTHHACSDEVNDGRQADDDHSADYLRNRKGADEPLGALGAEPGQHNALEDTRQIVEIVHVQAAAFVCCAKFSWSNPWWVRFLSRSRAAEAGGRVHITALVAGKRSAIRIADACGPGTPTVSATGLRRRFDAFLDPTFQCRQRVPGGIKT